MTAPRRRWRAFPRPAFGGLSSGSERGWEVLVLSCFGLTMLSGLALLVLYALGGQPQLEGVLLFVCLGSLGAGMVLWAQRLMRTPEVEEPRHELRSAPRAELDDTLAEEAGFARRTLLIRGLLGALAGLGAAVAIPVLSLGPAPGRSLYETGWRSGLRIVGTNGQPIRAEELPVGTIQTVFPEGAAGRADSQTLLIHVEPELLQLPGRGNDFAPEGYVAFSKICTHAGCPVGLYRASEHSLICPCHQSTFDVLRGAVPTFGPAARALPQLPIRRESDGTFSALGDYPEPVGPSFWNMR
jgi:ubiquinol-cytochrome c reductase iron-sulfur subunit